MYGTRARQADELGGAERVTRLKEIAHELRLNLGRKQDHATALRILCSEMGDGAGELLVFGEHGDTPEPENYGSRGRVARPDDANLKCLTERANEELKSLPVDQADRISVAWQRAARFMPTLVPHYSPTSDRLRRARG